jgi:methionine synthase II (cobalamin-independent)
VGSLPGTDIEEAVRLVFDELPDFPHLPELPARGPGADLIGRGAAFLVDLHVDLQPSGWRLIDRAGMDEHRARDFLSRDLDALEKQARDYTGPLKLQATGPWTLAASLERVRGDRALADLSACRDIAASLAEGLALHIADVQGRVPGSAICLQLDEPSLPAVLAGRVKSATGYKLVDPVDEPVAVQVLRDVVTRIDDQGAVPLAHCCAAQPPITTLRSAGVRAVGVDAAQLTARDDDAIGEAVEAGTSLLLGLVPALGPGVPPKVREVVAPARALWRRLGFDPELLGSTVVVTPGCGLAGASQGWARTALRLARQAGRVLVESPEGHSDGPISSPEGHSDGPISNRGK